MKERGWSEQGSQKMKELEELMQGSGFFNEGFSLGLGDVMELSDEESPSSPSQEEEVPPGSKPKSKGLPSIEGSETCAEFVSKYKRAVLNRRQVFKDAAERDEYLALERSNGQLSELYKEICDLERVQNKINPSAKAPYKEVTAKILEALIAFNNDMNAVKIFFKKSAAKSRAKKKASEIPKEEEE
ncbi:unnamed protein product [Durusdinium trenchii]|uniref:Uncharacterized protein n=2 Tax=Durusdinium trenchii TaxID=1381693 RepID=A0ABP0HT38_9DINO